MKQNHVPDNPLTPQERARLVDRHFEAMQARQFLIDVNYALAVKLGLAMKRQAGKG